MSSIIKVFLLLAAMICISKAQLNEASQQCLCQRFRRGIKSKTDIKEIQIHKATVFCDKVEIVVTLNSGLRYCLNPNVSAVKELVTRMMERQNIPNASGSL